MTLAKELVHILFSQSYASLGTVSAAGAPWVTPVVFTFDETMDMVWTSAADCRHSQNIRENARISFCIYDSHQPQNNPQGVYGEGRAVEVTDSLNDVAATFYRWRYPQFEEFTKKKRPGTSFTGHSPRRLFRATELQFYGISGDAHPIYGSLVDHRVPVDIKQSFEASWTERFR